MRLEIEACAFDIDGTLYPEWKLYLSLFPFTLRHFSLMNAFKRVRKEIRVYQEANPEEKQLNFFDFQAEMLSKHIKKDKEILKEEVKQKIYDGWKPVFSKIRPYNHAVKTIKTLKEKGIKIAILSDFLTEQKGDIWGILPFCDVVLSSENLGALKPSKIPFIALSNSLFLEPEKVLYVGNNLRYDIEGAASIGMKTALIRRGLHSLFAPKGMKADITFSDYRQLLEYI